MEPIQHRLFKIPDGKSVIIFVPTLRKVYRVEKAVAETLPNFVVAPAPEMKQNQDQVQDYCFTRATLLLTNQCRLGCIYCFGEYVPKPTKTIIMAPEVVHTTVDYLVESARRSGKPKIEAWMFGGEPTLPWNTLVEATQYLRAQALQSGLRSSVGITTNGCVIPQKAEWLAENMDHIMLSMDGPAEIHNAQRGGSFKRVFGTAKAIYQAAPRKLKFRITVSAAGVHRIAEMVRFFGENFPGCSQAYEPLFAMGRAKACPLAQPPDDSRFFKNFMKAVEVARTFNTHIRTSMTEAWRTTGETFCGAGGENFTVSYDGRVISCHRMAEATTSSAAPLFCYGHYNPATGGFVFNDERYCQIRQFTVASIPGCGDCFAQSSCRGDCPANKAVLSPRSFWREKSYRCKEIRKFSRDLLRYALDHGEQGLIF